MATTVDQIPGIMRAKGWTKAAALMERWFSLPATAYPDYAPPDTGTITWGWVLGFPEPRRVYDAAVNDAIWVNRAAAGVIGDKLRRDGLLTAGGSSFDWTGGTIQTLDANSTQFAKVSGGWSPDALSAALANFVFKFNVAGRVEPDPRTGHAGRNDATRGGRWKVTVETVKIYLRDSYDFHDAPGEDQPLGYWDAGDDSVSAWNAFSGTKITNGSFRAWRTANNQGGDFLIYTSTVRRLSGRSDECHVYGR